MTRSQQASRRSELIAQLGSLASELAALDELTFQRYTVMVEQATGYSEVEGLSYDGNLKGHLERMGIAGLSLPPDNDQRRVVIDASDAPTPLKVGVPDTDGEGNSFMRETSVPWTPAWW